MLTLLGSDGRDYVEENHNPDREVKKLLSIYKSKRVKGGVGWRRLKSPFL